MEHTVLLKWKSSAMKNVYMSGCMITSKAKINYVLLLYVISIKNHIKCTQFFILLSYLFRDALWLWCDFPIPKVNFFGGYFRALCNTLTQFAPNSFYMVAYLYRTKIQLFHQYKLQLCVVLGMCIQYHRKSCLHFRIHNAWNPFSTQHQF